MRDVIGTALAWLGAQRNAFMARTVTYRRGPDSVELAATPGRTMFRMADEAGAQFSVVTHDELITVADLVLDGLATEPQAGDRIEVTVGETVTAYQVASPGTGEEHFRMCDSYGRTYRVHTFLADEANE